MSNRKLANWVKIAHPVRWLMVLALFMAMGCEGTTDIERLRQEMYNQSRFEPLEKNTFFADNPPAASRPWIKGTVARGAFAYRRAFIYRGWSMGNPRRLFPSPLRTM